MLNIFLQIVFKHLKVLYFLTARSWKLPSEEVVHENGRVRRRATWEDDDNVDDGNDDGEEDDYGDDDAADSDDEDRDDQNSDIEESDKTRNENIKLNKTTVS
jgi:hypothetical protein